MITQNEDCSRYSYSRGANSNSTVCKIQKNANLERRVVNRYSRNPKSENDHGLLFMSSLGAGGFAMMSSFFFMDVDKREIVNVEGMAREVQSDAIAFLAGDQPTEFLEEVILTIRENFPDYENATDEEIVASIIEI